MRVIFYAIVSFKYQLDATLYHLQQEMKSLTISHQLFLPYRIKTKEYFMQRNSE